MNIGRLIKQLKIDEGISHRVYIDSLGYKTVGIGHLIKESDPEYLKDRKAGELITDEELNELFLADTAIAIQDAIIIFNTEWDKIPPIAQEVIVNMLFNLGRLRFLGFKKFIKAVYAKDWSTAAAEMMDSQWATQVVSRASRLSSKIRGLS